VCHEFFFPRGACAAGSGVSSALKRSIERRCASSRSDLNNENAFCKPSSDLLSLFLSLQSKFAVFAALVASASAFAPSPAFQKSTAIMNQKVDWDAAAELGWSMGGEDYTREVKPINHEDSRKSIHDAPSFEEYMKQRAAGN
jgi:hypothetical protein